MSSFSNTPSNFDNLLLQTLMGRLQIRPSPPPHRNLIEDLSLEDLLLNLSEDDNDDDNGNSDSLGSRSQLSKEEANLEKEIVRVILSGNTDSLKPNSGQAVSIGEHHICVGFHEEKSSDYRVWEWHGHIMLFDEETGYTPEYIYGNYFERLFGKVIRVEKKEDEEEKEEEEERTGNLGLRELIDDGDSVGARILHRNISAAPQRGGGRPRRGGSVLH